MAAAFVKTTGVVRAAGFSGTSAGSFGTLPAVGNHVIVGIALYDGDSGTHGIATVTDNQGNTYVENVEATEIGGGNSSATIYSTKVGTSAGTFTVTVDPAVASGLYIAWAAAEFSGLDATTHLDRTGTNNNTTGDANVTASAANTTTNGVALAVAALSFGDIDLNIGDVPPTGYSNIAVEENANDYMGMSFVYKVYSATETSAATWVHDNESQFGWSAAIATYKAAAGAGAVDITGVGNINAPTAFGTNQVSVVGGVVGLTLTGLAVATAFGTAVVAPEITLTLNGVAVPTAFGTSIVAVSGGPVGISLSGIAVPVSFFSTDTGGELEWQAVASSTEYRIKYGTAQGGPYGSTYDTGSTATSVNVSLLTVTPGTRYYAVVCPMDGVTEGNPSPEISFVPGAMQLSSINQLAFSGLAVPTAFGTEQVSQGGAAVGMTLNGVAVPTAFGTSVVAPEVTLTLSGVAVPTAFGTAIVASAGGPVTLAAVGGIAVPTNFGTAAIAGGTRTLTLPGLAVGTLFGRSLVYDPVIGPPEMGKPAGWRHRKLGFLRRPRWRMY